MSYTVYYLSSIENPEDIRYIGITKNDLSGRLSAHKCAAKRVLKGVQKRTYLYSWLISIQFKAQITSLDSTENVDELGELEKYYIKLYRKLGYELTNTSEGGDGGPTGLVYSKNHMARSVLQYSLKGDFIAAYSCIKEAGEAVGVTPNLISGCLNMDRVRSAGGFQWRDFIEGYPLEIEEYTIVDQRASKAKYSKPVYQYDLEGNLIKLWSSKRLLESVTGYSRRNITKAINDKKLAYGYMWLDVES